jgi:hypothetical protein
MLTQGRGHGTLNLRFDTLPGGRVRIYVLSSTTNPAGLCHDQKMGEGRRCWLPNHVELLGGTCGESASLGPQDSEASRGIRRDGVPQSSRLVSAEEAL